LYGKAEHTWLKTVAGLSAFGGQAKAVLSETLDEKLCEYMMRGGRVVMAAPEGMVRPFLDKFGLGIGYFFLPPANYPPYEDGHCGVIVSDGPILGEFPHEGFADYQLYRPIINAPPIDLEPLGLGAAKPAIRAISSYFVAAPVAYLVESQVGKGGLVICALELDQKWPEARYLLASIAAYAAGESFRPKNRVTKQALGKLIEAAQ
jgi:hypothetical protein